jgi:glucose/mannose-6-phosphate isomerase
MDLADLSVLSDPKKIKLVDRSDMLSYCVDAPKHYQKAASLAERLSADYSKPDNIVVAGMGGSAIGGELLKDWARDVCDVPIEVCREYSLPLYAGRKTLVVVVSYSGETEESLSVFLDAYKRKCKMMSISSGGELQKFSEKLGIPHLRVPSGMAPRATLPYLFVPLPLLLQKLELASKVKDEISEVVDTLKTVSDANAPARSIQSSVSKKLASRLYGKIPIVYGFGIYRAAAQRFKTQFNENSKVPAKWEYFPELNHNEIVGWETIDRFGKCFGLIFVRDDEESEAMKLRIETTRDLIGKGFLEIFEVRSLGASKMAKMCSVICTGDFTSVYLAVLNGIDPTPVKTIGLLKEKLRPSGVRDKVIRELRKIAAG